MLDMKKNILKQKDYDSFLKEKLEQSRGALKAQKNYEIELQNQIQALQAQVAALREILEEQNIKQSESQKTMQFRTQDMITTLPGQTSVERKQASLSRNL